MRPIPPPLCISAQTENELLPKLAEVDINMPERGERDTRHGERYSIVHFLRYLCSIGELAYPLKLEQRERPDFLLTINGVTIGIEHTEAVPQNQAHEDSRRGNLDHRDFASFDDRHMPDDPRRSSKEIDARLTRKKEYFEALKPNQDQLQGVDDYEDVIGEGWAGDEPEVEWAEWMRHFIKDKNKKLSAPDWGRFNHNWLLTYDNLTLPKVDYESAAEKLFVNLEAGFDAVFILCGRKVCRIRPGNDLRVDDLPDAV